MKKVLLMMALVAMVFATGCKKKETYTVTFSANGGEGSMVAQTFTEGEAQALTVNAFTREGYSFVEWNTIADGSGTKYDNQQTIVVSENMTLYAQWKSDTPGVVPVGGIDGIFSVSSTKRVWFSKGNLQYQASTNTWRFAENQWDYVGSDNENISSSYSGWIDLFGWGTGNNPTNISQSNSDYSSFTDWGSNPISNGGNPANQWRTLTKAEWEYLLNTRTTTSGIRYARAEVNGKRGLIILPDDWSTSYYTLSSTNTAGAECTANTISSADWTSEFEAHGAVFLPAAGGRNGTSAFNLGGDGYYWSSTPDDSDYAYALKLVENLNVNLASCYYGQSVRLVAED